MTKDKKSSGAKGKKMKNFCDNCGGSLTDKPCSAGHVVRLFEYRLQHKHEFVCKGCGHEKNS